MNGVSAILGGLICCVVPLLCFAGGIYYARYGLPFSIRWRGLRAEDEALGED